MILDCSSVSGQPNKIFERGKNDHFTTSLRRLRATNSSCNMAKMFILQAISRCQTSLYDVIAV